MAEAAAAARTALAERVRRFQFERFDPHAEQWEYYVQRFETELAINGLLDDPAEGGPATEVHRRNLLLARVGPDAFKVLVDHFRPEAVNTKQYLQLKQVLQSFYQQNICIMAERVVFSQRVRKSGETVTQFVNSLRALAGNCDFGALLQERLRDQLVIGIQNDLWQQELFRMHPTNASTLAQVEATALVLEQASMQQQRLHNLTKSGAGNAAAAADDQDVTSVRRIKQQSSKQHQMKSAAQPGSAASATATKQTVRQLIRGKHCFKCGYSKHAEGEGCAASRPGIVCASCKKPGHLSRACVTSGNAELVKTAAFKTAASAGQRKQLYKVSYADDNDDNDDDDTESCCDDLNTIASIAAGKFAVLNVALNGHGLQMLYDPGAAFSVVSRQI